MEQKSSKTLLLDLLMPLFLLVLTTVYLFASLQISPQVDEGLTGPKFLPILSTIGMYIVLAIIIFKTIRKNRIPCGKENDSNVDWKGIVFFVVATALYIALFKVLGYLLDSFLYVFCLLYVFGLDKCGLVKRVAYAIAITAIFYFLYAFVFQVRLPMIEVLS